MVGWHHWLNGHEFEQTLGNTEGQGKDWRAAVHEVERSQTGLSDWTIAMWGGAIHVFFFYLDLPAGAMQRRWWRPHSSTLAWKIPWMEEPGGLQSMGSRRVGHNWATSLSLFTFMHWRRKWQPTLVFLPGESQGLGSLVGCRLWGCTESDTTEAT